MINTVSSDLVWEPIIKIDTMKALILIMHFLTKKDMQKMTQNHNLKELSCFIWLWELYEEEEELLFPGTNKE